MRYFGCTVIFIIAFMTTLSCQAQDPVVDFAYAFATPHRMTVAPPESGDKTLLDALIPAVESIKASGAAGESFAVALPKGAAAAIQGGENTKLIAATKGRASYVGDRSISFPDAGATAIGIIYTRLLAR